MSDRSDFRNATRQWESLHREGMYSEPARYGTAAILFSMQPELDLNPSEGKNQIDYFAREAYGIACQIYSEGGKAVVYEGITNESLSEVLSNPKIATIYTIGNGGLSFIRGKNSTENSSAIYDWLDVSYMTTHLKLGSFIQRTCGLFDYDLSVPLGTFAVSDHSNVIAPVGEYFSPEAFGQEAEEKLCSVCEQFQLTYEDVKDLFPKHDDSEPTVESILSSNAVFIDTSKKD